MGTWKKITEIMGPKRYRVRLLNEDQLWYHHQNQLRYRHVEHDNTQSAEITGATARQEILPLSFCIMRSQQKMLKQLPQSPFQQQVKVREEHVVTHYRIVDL